MIIKEFLEKLSKVAKRNKFVIKDGLIRHKSTDMCPICFLCYKLTKNYYSNVYYLSAAKEIGLRKRDVSSISYAADSANNKTRNKLLKALNLEAK